MSAATLQPIADNELELLLGATLAGPVALAVSGGADSMALMHLAARLLARRSDIMLGHGAYAPSHDAHVPGRGADDRVCVFTVDHQLRPDSAAEAGFVKVEAERLGFPHRTLQWRGDKPATGLAAAARVARYALMTDAIKSERLGCGPQRRLVTAHHGDDQAETLLMRLARGSGVTGLAAMRTHSQIDGVDLMRPLLGVSKARLMATLQASGATWVDDPSNENAAFERVRVRHAMPALATMGIDSRALARSAARLARADLALEEMTNQLAIDVHAERHRGAYASLDLKAFRAGWAEARIRLLARLLNVNGGQSEGPELSQIEVLDGQICAEDSGAEPRASGAEPSRAALASVSGGATLGGCTVRWRTPPGCLQIFRETGRAGLPDLVLGAGQAAVWDRRFYVQFAPGPHSLSQTGPGRVTVAALGGQAYATLRKLVDAPLPALAGATLPAFFQDGILIAVPYFADQRLVVAGSNSDLEAVCKAIPLD